MCAALPAHRPVAPRVTCLVWQVAGVRGKEKDMQAGLGIFAIEPPANKETAQTEKDLDLLQQAPP